MAGFGNGVDKTHRCPQLGLAEDANDTVVSTHKQGVQHQGVAGNRDGRIGPVKNDRIMMGSLR